MEKINLVELLKDCPKGMELDCVMYDNNVQLDTIQDGNAFPIKINTPEGRISLSKYGCCSLNQQCKCVIFPKGKTTWEGFKRPFKDGDVVTRKYRGLLEACIYKERKNTATFNHHIALYKGVLGIVVNGEIVLTDDELCLATEEEKQKLFDAIKENGYKWNSETKTLEKLITLKFKIGDKIRAKGTNSYTKILGIKWEQTETYYETLLCEISVKDQDKFELVSSKFDITTLKPFESRVLVRDKDNGTWSGQFFSHIEKSSDKPFVCIGVIELSEYSQCIPYEGNEHLLGTTNDCDEYYKTWK